MDPFLSSFETTALSSHATLHSVQEESRKKLKNISLKELPALRGVSLRHLYADPFRLAVQEDIEHTNGNLVFVNGYFDPSLSSIPEGVICSFLEDAFGTHSAFLQAHLKRFVKQEEDPFVLLNLVLNVRAAFVYIPKNKKTSLKIVYVQSGQTQQVVAPRVHLIVGQHSEVECTVKTEGEGSHLQLPVIDAICEEGSSCRVFNLAQGTHLIDALRVQVRKGASFKAVYFTRGGKTCRLSYDIALKEEQASADISGLTLLDKNFSAHAYGQIAHRAPHTHSMQKFKSVLDGVSRFGYSGKIVVDPIAQKTQAYQLNKTLLLSPHAIVTSEPNLEIRADDVKASHGSTISQLSPLEMFYLKTRGIDEIEGKQLLLKGFCDEILSQLESFL
ncbi:MAG: FeS assembly protein SufD [Chlamydiota bacterium]|jgi:Fe-S cluster assembly protein SufD